MTAIRTGRFLPDRVVSALRSCRFKADRRAEVVVSVSVVQGKNFIGGEWSESSNGETMEVLNPATGEVIAEVARSTADDVERAVDAARKAWVEWQNKTPKDRMELLNAL